MPPGIIIKLAQHWTKNVSLETGKANNPLFYLLSLQFPTGSLGIQNDVVMEVLFGHAKDIYCHQI